MHGSATDQRPRCCTHVSAPILRDLILPSLAVLNSTVSRCLLVADEFDVSTRRIFNIELYTDVMTFNKLPFVKKNLLTELSGLSSTLCTLLSAITSGWFLFLASPSDWSTAFDPHAKSQVKHAPCPLPNLQRSKSSTRFSSRVIVRKTSWPRRSVVDSTSSRIHLENDAGFS